MNQTSISSARAGLSQKKQPLAARLLDLEIWVVAGLAALSILSERFLVPSLAAAGFFWLLRLATLKRLSVRTPMDWALVGLVAMLPVSLAVSPFIEITRVQVLQLLVGVALFYSLVNWMDTSHRLKLVLVGLCVVGIGLGLVGLVSVDWMVDKLRFIPQSSLAEIPHLIGEKVHPNVLAGSLVLLALIPAGWLLFDWRGLGWLARLGLALSSAFMMIVQVFTQSRGSYMALASGLALLVLLRWPKWAWAPLSLAAGFGYSYLTRNNDLVQLMLLRPGGGAGSVEGRLEIWSRAMLMLHDFPFTGIGMGVFEQTANTLYPFGLDPANIPHAHNLFFQVAVDLGLPGLICWVAVLLTVAACAWQVYRAGRRTRPREFPAAGVGAALLAVQLALVVHGQVDAVTWGTRPALIVWVLWGTAASAWRLVNTSKTRIPP